MTLRQLGDSDLNITRIGIGAWAIGGGKWEFGWGPQNNKDSIAAIHAGLVQGLNWIDTAAAYGLFPIRDQAVDDFLGNSLAEEFMFRDLAKACKRQHRYGVPARRQSDAGRAGLAAVPEQRHVGARLEHDQHRVGGAFIAVVLTEITILSRDHRERSARRTAPLAWPV